MAIENDEGEGSYETRSRSSTYGGFVGGVNEQRRMLERRGQACTCATDLFCGSADGPLRGCNGFRAHGRVTGSARKENPIVLDVGLGVGSAEGKGYAGSKAGCNR